ncbi:MAG: diacylglycerol/polyprenol kinase family protein [Nanoarchaeota archaeon]|nr:SEC59/DGK1/VTE5 family protein [Nanoarchaeota archaeon]MBU1631909.1 SEC59/DGK1/VTE5 family protein [Nanoarchaeota archaeon]MBU1876604.1 SEC59/DGK1/VTE5 family protein [Nanoarchaeota archaeon]
MLSKQEMIRQIIHILVGLGVIVLFYFDILSSFAVFLLIIIGIIASFICKRTNLPFFSFFLKHFEREDMKKNFPGRGLIYYFVGILLVMRLFEKDIALAAIMILSLGDSVSHIVGERFGQIKNIFNGKSKKLLEGTLVGTFAGFIGAVFFVPIPEAFIGSLIAMIAEVVEIDFNKNTLDDNLIVPLVAGTAMFLVRNFI